MYKEPVIEPKLFSFDPFSRYAVFYAHLAFGSHVFKEVLEITEIVIADMLQAGRFNGSNEQTPGKFR